MKNKMSDVWNMLVAQMERLNDDELCVDIEQVAKEEKRASAMVGVTEQLLNMAQLQLKAFEVAEEYGCTKAEMPPLLAD